MLVYLIRNKVNGKVYVGQTIQRLKERWAQHRLCATVKTRCLHNALTKYGHENFTIEVLSYARNLEELTRLEKRFIEEYQSYPPSLGKGYNMTPGGYGGGHYSRHSEESKLKVSLANKGRTLSPEAREAMSLRCKGIPKTPEHIAKVAAALKGRIMHRDDRKKLREGWRRRRARLAGNILEA